MLIESFVQNPDAAETHSVEISAPREAVYRALWEADLGGSALVRGLMALRSLPGLICAPRRRLPSGRKVTLRTLTEAGFGRLAEEPGREIVLGVTGKFWRPSGNIAPFDRESFRGPVPAGFARAVWNFTVAERAPGRTVLSTETRVVCGDAASRARFRLYWLAVRPFSGLIRVAMLRAVRRACEARAENHP